MYKSIEIKNFRLFKDFTIEGLGRVNLIVGKNNVGKTSLLEALFLQQGPSNPTLELRINTMRGLEDFGNNPKEIWGSLFYKSDLQNKIKISTIDDSDIPRTIKIALTTLSGKYVTKNGQENIQEMLADTSSVLNLQKEYIEKNKKHLATRAFPVSEGIQFQSKKDIHRPNGHFIGARTRTKHSDNAKLFGNLAKEKREKQLIKYLNEIEPNLRSLSVLLLGSESIIWGDIGDEKLLPIFALGDGINRLLNIILAILNSSEGIVLIDEIENGLYHKNMVKVWRAIYDIADENNVQVFATTHSDECVEAARQAFEGVGEDEFKFFRLRRKDERIEAVGLDWEMLNASAEMGLEVR